MPRLDEVLLCIFLRKIPVAPRAPRDGDGKHEETSIPEICIIV